MTDIAFSFVADSQSSPDIFRKRLSKTQFQFLDSIFHQELTSLKLQQQVG
jgi:hypothetical protein